MDVDLVREIAIRCAWRLVNAYLYRKVTQFTLRMLTEPYTLTLPYPTPPDAEYLSLFFNAESISILIS